MSNRPSIDALNEALMSTISELRNPASKQCDIDRAKAISELGKVMIEGYKVKASVLNNVKDHYPDSAREMLRNSGIQDENPLKKIG